MEIPVKLCAVIFFSFHDSIFCIAKFEAHHLMTSQIRLRMEYLLQPLICCLKSDIPTTWHQSLICCIQVLWGRPGNVSCMCWSSPNWFSKTAHNTETELCEYRVYTKTTDVRQHYTFIRKNMVHAENISQYKYKHTAYLYACCRIFYD